MKKILGSATIFSLTLFMAFGVLGSTGVSANQINDQEDSCTPVTLVVVSDSSTQDGNGDSSELTSIHSAWTADLEGNHPDDGSKWIWEINGVETPTQDESVTFTKEFSWDGDTIDSATLYLASDNSHVANLNDSLAGEDTSEDNFRNTTDDIYDVISLVQEGTNTLKVEVKNWALGGGTEQTNPGGLLYHLVIEGEDCPEPESPKTIGDDSVRNRNSAYVTSISKADADTGDNYAGGAEGGNGGNAGDIENGGDDVDDSGTGNGGAGGDASRGSGGMIETGDAGAYAGVVTIANSNVTRINRCACGGDDNGDTKVRNRNGASVFSLSDAEAETGDNTAKGAEGGEGGNGGDIDNGHHGDDVDDSGTGNGGRGGTSGEGGLIMTGGAHTGVSSFSALNQNRTTIRR